MLLAEDEREMRSLIAGGLRKDGYHVVEAEDGSRLVEFLQADGPAEPIDIVISDLRMPGWNGLAILTHLRQDDWAIPFILITAYGDERTHEEARRLGATAVFDKPFDVDDLRTLVFNLVPPRWPL